MTDSFYGGPAGRSFEITWSFQTRYNTGNGDNTMQHDIEEEWRSPIPIGAFVVISYGMPGDKNYTILRDGDLAASAKYDDNKILNYNSTLWEKVFNKETGKPDYKLVTALTGSTPALIMKDANPEERPIDNYTKTLDADQRPQVWININNPDEPVLYFALPRSQILSLNQPITRLKADELPNVIFDEGKRDANGNPVMGEHNGTINNPTLTMELPRSQVIKSENVKIEPVAVDTDPSIVFDTEGQHADGEFKINEPIVTFKLPMAQIISVNPQVTWIDHNDDATIDIEQKNTIYNNEPYLTFKLPQNQKIVINSKVNRLKVGESPEVSSKDLENGNVKEITFSLPDAQVMQDPQTVTIPPTADPYVDMEYAKDDEGQDDKSKPYIVFHLPRSAKFNYGDLMGEEQNYDNLNDESLAEVEVGDYYVNRATGFVYVCIAKEGTVCSFSFQSGVQPPVPNVNQIEIDTFDEDGNVNQMETGLRKVEDELNAWMIDFTIPKVPELKLDTKFVGSQNNGKSSLDVSAPSELTINIEIPAGAKIFSGDQVTEDNKDTVEISRAQNGDLYINTDTGIVYQISAAGKWVAQTGSLKGPVGPSLNIIKTFTIEFDDNYPDTLDNTVDYILDHYDGEITPDCIFAVNWYDDEVENTYWVFRTEDGEWGRALVTGSARNLLEQDYTTDHLEDRTYSLGYINSLIGSDDDIHEERTAFSKLQTKQLLGWDVWTTIGSIENTEKKVIN